VQLAILVAYIALQKVVRFYWSWIKSYDERTVELRFSFKKASITQSFQTVCSFVCPEGLEISLYEVTSKHRTRKRLFTLPDSFSYLASITPTSIS